ncbi:MAG: hypothetical protein UW35_C0002G0020 [Candidatus Collierbacteria bacterium GW2011_GWF2_44_15]|uniref:Type II secretion system protein n=5 Tax=Candidatus Collieribacteriota TaxID=1752725 RepID=A0A0G1HIZ0_9BACT|nr:MAG: hypothetical protein UW23_C0002G0012 [Candidatus Collierbacteria bacterium GW2011_GWA1_44_12]KKT37926.1 MAG: hypothetical protein UW26_C0023G0002 [Candidatus Collierbacteria bacterium GW2011_GWF1_44_12]KKT47191.1 MAG: hypothetical protein UW35_C0002G0020 [Candidatus Collierbacteria bacterium GW2011_GWF2_44_15]KKT99437.1 MAG: hypothetical protein UW99_C0006G0010 [Candidatus Collierbacteria bacterium GW2011_GWC2_45_15]KKU28633.1 MAG: hypothetical protein UX41_C0030G0004 [Candidatus Collie
MKQRKFRGQLLAEVVIAIGLLALILVGMSELITRSSATTRINKEKDEAGRVVEARLSYFRQQRSRDPVGLYNSIDDLFGSGFVDCGGSPWPIIAQYNFSCTQSFSLLSPGVVQIDVKASWTNKTTNDLSVTLSNIITF